MRVEIPTPALVVFIGGPARARTSLASRLFAKDQLLAATELDRSFERFAEDGFTAIAGPLESKEARQPWIAAAKHQHVLPVAITLGERNVPSPESLTKEGFRKVITLRTREDQASATLVKLTLECNRQNDPGPFDLIGDIHGCREELEELLSTLGYRLDTHTHPRGRRVVFLGDLVDRGPEVPGVVRTVMQLVENGTALCVIGNHDAKLARALTGKNVAIGHGLAESLDQLSREPPQLSAALVRFFDSLPSHYVLDHGALVAVHAGLREEMQGRDSGRVRAFAMYGDTTGESDEYGLPVRRDWALGYSGKAQVVYGHTPVLTPEWVNGTIDIDTGCVFGGKLTALRYPELELVSVPARRAWWPPSTIISPRATRPPDPHKPESPNS